MLIGRALQLQIRPSTDEVTAIHTKIPSEPRIGERCGLALYSDEHAAYTGLPLEQEMVKHSVKEYVREEAHTNGVESVWAALKRGYQGIYHKMSSKHLDRYVREFAGRHNLRPEDTLEQMSTIANRMGPKRLPYRKLTVPNGLDRGAVG